MIRIEPRSKTSRTFEFGIQVLSAIVSLALAAIPLLLAGANPIAAYGQMIKGVFGSVFAVSEMLTRATPLIFTGLAAALATSIGRTRTCVAPAGRSARVRRSYVQGDWPGPDDQGFGEAQA